MILLRLTLLLFITGLGCSPDSRPMAESAKLRASDGEANNYFGYVVATDGARAIVGAYGDDDRGANAGAAYVFAQTNHKWKEEAKLIPLQARPNEQVGMAVAIEGDFAWVGSRGDIEAGPQTGSAYVFRRFSDGWVQVGRFRSVNSDFDDQYGLSIAAGGNWAAVGAYGDPQRGHDAGSVYLYKLENDVWQFSEQLYAPRGGAADYFGYSVDISGDRLIVGAFGDDDRGNRAGAAYIFRRVADAWEPEIKLTARDGGKHNLFGHSVALSGKLALVGAHGNHSLGRFSGAAYLFVRSQRGWVMRQKLEAPDRRANKYFGFSVDISPKRILIGARGDSHDRILQAGAAYTFTRSGSKYGNPTKHIAQLSSELDFLGRSVAISDGFGLAGAHGDDDTGSLSGSVYAF